MSGPWDKYAGQSDPGPWAKYSQPRERQMENGMPVFPDLPGEGRPDSPKPSAFRGVTDWLSNVGNAFTGARAQQWTDNVPLLGPAYGATEAATSLVSGIADPITAPLFAGGKVGGGTYEPRSGYGQQILRTFGAATEPAVESGAADVLGAMAPELGALRRPSIPLTAKQAVKQVPMRPIPSTAELRAAKNEAYKAGNESSILTTPQENATTVSRVNEALKSENLVVDPDLHPKATALLRRLNAQKDQPLTVPEAESLRQLALEVERDIDPVTKQPTADAYRAGVILDELDNSLDTLSVNKPARELNSRFRRSQMIDEMIRRAEIKAGANYTQAGMEHALRQEFKNLALNTRRMRGLTMEQKASIEKVAKGGSLENGLRNLGKFDPTTGGMAAFIGTGTGGAIGGALAGVGGGGLGALAVPALGFLAKRGATKLTARNVDLAREAMVGRGPPNVATSTQARGLLGAGEAPVSGPLLGAVRPAEQIRQDLMRLDARMKSLPPNEPPNSARLQSLLAELARLRGELSRAESQGASP